MNKRLLIVAASARPWIPSAHFAGMSVDAFDFFADWDSHQFKLNRDDRSTEGGVAAPSTIQQIARFSDLLQPGYEEVIQRCNAALVCGGIETQVGLIESLADRLAVLGPTPKQLARMRNATEAYKFLRQQGISVPNTKSVLKKNDDPSQWLKKTCGSSGGLGVSLATKDDVGQFQPDSYYQSIVEGDSASAALVSFRDRSGDTKTEFLGVTRQMVGDHEFGARRFAYCGSLGNFDLPGSEVKQIAHIGRSIANEFEMVGLWGIDFILSQNGPILVDINPRLTASMELYEQALQRAGSIISSIVDLHVNACSGQLDELEIEQVKNAFRYSDETAEGKAILFNRTDQPIRICSKKFAQLQKMFDFEFFHSLKPGFSIVDVPNEGQCIMPGQPILTLRVRARDDQVSSQLRKHAERIYGTL